MSINFPNNPLDGQIYQPTSTTVYTYVASKGYWRFGNKNIPIEIRENTYDAGINAIIFSGVWDLDKENNDIHTFMLMGV